MANPWDGDPIITPAPKAPPAGAMPWANDPIVTPATPSTGKKALDAVQSARSWLATQGADALAGQMEMVSPLGPINKAVTKGAEMAGVQVPEWAQWLLQPGHKMARAAYDSGVIPETRLPGPVGKVVDAGVQGALSGMPLKGGLTFGMMLPNALGGGLSEAAGQQVAGSKWEPLARIGAGVLGGSTAALGGIRPTAGQLVNQSTKGMTPAEWAAAKGMQAESNTRGINLMGHEALTADSASPLGQLFGNVAASQSGGPMRAAAANRIPGMKAAIESELDHIAPKTVDPKAVDIALAEAADRAVKVPQAARSNAAKPDFDAASGQPLDWNLKLDLLSKTNAALKEALPGSAKATQLKSLQTKLRSSQTVGHLDDARDEFKAIIESQAFTGEKIPDKVRIAIKPLMRDIKGGLEDTSPPYAAGMSKYDPANPLTQEVTAAQTSGAGQIADAHGGKPSQAMGLFGKWIMSPDNARPATVRADMARLKAQDPQAANAALRLYLENVGDAAFKETRGSPAIYGGSNFKRDVAGTDIQRSNLLAAVEGATGNQTTAAGFAKLIDILNRTGVTPGLGSPTATRGAMAQQVGASGPLNTALEAVDITRMGPVGSLKRWGQNARLGKVYGELADITTNPEGVKLLHELALLRSDSARAKALASAILQGGRGAQVGVTP